MSTNNNDDDDDVHFVLCPKSDVGRGHCRDNNKDVFIFSTNM